MTARLIARQGRARIAGVLITLASTCACILPAAADPITELLGGGEAETSAPSASPATNAAINPEVSVADDRLIKLRLTNIFSELDGMSEIIVNVRNSVVTLSGEVVSSKAITQAEALASNIDGVVEVNNDVNLVKDVSQRLESSLDRLSSVLRSITLSLPTLLLALVVTGVICFLGRCLANQKQLFQKISPNVFIADLLANLSWLIISLMGLFAGLSLLDATQLIGSILGAAGIFGLAIGFAVRDTVENYIASILLSLRNPFLIRDFVAIGDNEGSVARLTSRATILISADGNHIRIPNATVYKSVITNYSRNPERRFEFTVGIDSEDDIAIAQRLGIDTLLTVPGILTSPGPMVLVGQLGDSNVALIVHAWIDQRTHDLLKVRSEAIRQLKGAYDGAGIVMPEPIYRVVINQKADLSPAAVHTSSSDGKPAKASVQQTSRVVDTTTDGAVHDTLQKEIQKSGSDNLLTGTAPHE